MLRIEPADAVRSPTGWQIVWRLHNPDRQPMQLSRAWLPHSQFRGPELTFDPPIVIPPNGEVSLETAASCPRTPGLVVENAFLILRLDDQRVFVRLRVTIQAGGRPELIVESVTTTPSGPSARSQRPTD
jgi:hypothetical protein